MRERKWGSKEIGGKKEEDLKGSYINDTSVSVKRSHVTIW